MNRPIESGCLAMIINSKCGQNGICVTVLNFIGQVNGWCGNNRWNIDKIITGTYGKKHAHADETCLMRIDPDPDEFKEVKKEVVLINEN